MPLYDFWARSGDPDAVKIRAYWNDIFERCQLPEKAKRKIQRGFRGAGRKNEEKDIKHLSMLFELFMYELLTKVHYEVRYEPKMGNREPDYMVRFPRGIQFYLEATCTLGDGYLSKRGRSTQTIIDTINSVESSYFRVSLELEWLSDNENIQHDQEQREDYKVESDDLESLKNWISENLAGAKYDDLLANERDRRIRGDYYAGCWHEYMIGSAAVRIQLIPIDPPKPSIGRLVMLSSHAESGPIKTRENIRNKVYRKTNQMSNSRLPVVVAINLFADFLDETDILDALFGDLEYCLYPSSGSIVIVDEERKKGPWAGKKEGNNRAQNTTLSAILIFRDIGIFARPSVKPIMILNPNAKNPIHPADVPLPFVDYFVIESLGNKMRLTPVSEQATDQARQNRWDLWPLGLKH